MSGRMPSTTITALGRRMNPLRGMGARGEVGIKIRLPRPSRAAGSFSGPIKTFGRLAPSVRCWRKAVVDHKKS
ncbi:hypothetical protein BQ8482_70052 [Mesorhizobium delmotii]|uniref:Uncharacterized protein n=1 Tax=Mesorhizobium delmotii TaxID=1631247 RepID=A0A2P9AVY9_9HYPH|nr:hypothetical protein BQ8482_70052 [Mesorhizobium delmotii]